MAGICASRHDAPLVTRKGRLGTGTCQPTRFVRSSDRCARVFYAQNVQEVRSQGVELVASKDDVLIPGLELSGSVTYVHSRVLKDAAFPPAVG